MLRWLPTREVRPWRRRATAGGLLGAIAFAVLAGACGSDSGQTNEDAGDVPTDAETDTNADADSLDAAETESGADADSDADGDADDGGGGPCTAPTCPPPESIYVPATTDR